MKKVDLKTESLEFEFENNVFRAIPFYELSIEEWVIYQNGRPKYFLNLDKQNSSFINQVKVHLDKGIDLETIINRIGKYLGIDWTTYHNIQGIEKQNSYKPETIELEEINEFSEIANQLLFIATDNINEELLKDEDKLIESHFENGQINIAYSIMDRNENVTKLLNFIFPTINEPQIIFCNEQVQCLNLNPIKEHIIAETTLESKYMDWIKGSERNNTMDEYGNLVEIIEYAKRNQHKKYLLLCVKKRKTVPNIV